MCFSSVLGSAGSSAGGGLLGGLVDNVMGGPARAAGNIKQASNMKAAAAAQNYNAQIQHRNAQIQEQMAKDAEERGKEESAAYRRKIRRLRGQQRARYGASGVLVNSGSPLAVQMDTAKFGEMDALTLEHNAAREAWGHRAQKTNFLNEAKQLEWQAGRYTKEAQIYERKAYDEFQSGMNQLSGGFGDPMTTSMAIPQTMHRSQTTGESFWDSAISTGWSGSGFNTLLGANPVGKYESM
ncbi:MAG: hypothetical protein K9M56_04250 [Victivallales bacterium]|nr:hypothetical protein [Victivallales bacterium]